MADNFREMDQNNLLLQTITKMITRIREKCTCNTNSYSQSGVLSVQVSEPRGEGA